MILFDAVLDARSEARYEPPVSASPSVRCAGNQPTTTSGERNAMPSPYWVCAGCGTRNQRSHVKCRGESCNRRRPKKRVPAHARTLRDDSYEVYEKVNAKIHAAAFNGEWTPACCGCCGKPPKARRHDRDHDHRTGKPRGLACWHCNRELLRHADLAQLRVAVAYLERAEAYYAGVGS